MVNLTGILLRRNPFNVQPDNAWKRRQVLRLSAHFYGRKRNCYSFAIRAVQKSLQLMTIARKELPKQIRALYERRVTAAVQELGYMPQGTPTLMEGLAQQQILLDRRMLQELAIWEPRTFKAVNKIAAAKAHDVNVPNLGPKPRLS